MNLQEEMLKIKNEMIDEFDKRVEALKVDEQEFPQSGERYWCINGGGVASSYFWKSEQFDLDRYRVDNIFKTIEQAHFAAEKLKVEAELRKFSRPFEYGENNHIICVEKNINRLFTIGRLVDHYQGAIYFESKGKAEEAIRSVGAERIEKYIFGLED